MRAIASPGLADPKFSISKTFLSPPPDPARSVRHSAIGLNFIDTYHRSGLYPVSLPSRLGLEAAGTIEALGDGVSGFNVADRVAYCSGPLGAYAEANNVAADRVVKLPAGISNEVAAASLLKGMTAQYLLKRTYPVKPGDTILVHAAAGGVGMIACQWAKHLGAEGHRNRRLRQQDRACQDPWLRTRAQHPQRELGRRSACIDERPGVPVVDDFIGKDTFSGPLDRLAIRGLMASFGNASGAVPAFEPGILGTKGSLYLTRPSLFHDTRDALELQATADDLFAVIASGAVKIAIHQRFPLAQARAGPRSAAFSRNGGRHGIDSRKPHRRGCAALWGIPAKNSSLVDQLEYQHDLMALPSAWAKCAKLLSKCRRICQKAQDFTGEGITETVRVGLKKLALIRARQKARKLRGKVKFSLSINELRYDRE